MAAGGARSAITGTGLWVPRESIDNEELVQSHRLAVAAWNAAHAEEIAAGRAEARDASTDAWIVRESALMKVCRSPNGRARGTSTNRRCSRAKP